MIATGGILFNQVLAGGVIAKGDTFRGLSQSPFAVALPDRRHEAVQRVHALVGALADYQALDGVLMLVGVSVM